jgi:2-amino-4-hydroxy-6-hydroxymethyldihydropteridine diphosphokinase
MHEIGLGLGGNVGDPATTIRVALNALQSRGIAVIEKVSSLYRTAPWGGVPQPDYANACVIGLTNLTALDLLSAVKQLERDLGRVDTVRWGPRVIDIDILYYDDVALAGERLVIPHRELFNRTFVLVPLAEITPDLIIAGHRVADAAQKAPSDGVTLWNASAP